ncbi:MAG: hypothetical protein P9F19_11495 [Candidatus Contendobacter sp.]|nr:hypothetical protein [Candidatus Contendobacter sp.]MDG4557992.1 hypothetical protein [Candidatus Contendobacter sp.]
MMVLSQSSNPEPERRIGIGWIGVVLVLALSAIGLGIGARIDFGGQHHEWFRAAVFGAFTLVNSLRILAYVPQMLAAAKDTNGASGISYATWSLFLVSHLTTITYAAVYLGDALMALIFFGNALACLAVIAITFVKRRRHAARLKQRL